MLKSELERKKNDLLTFCCEICGTSLVKPETSINEFHKDGTIKIHYTCSNHIVDIYDKIIKEIESK
jgi:hypothetical protein